MEKFINKWIVKDEFLSLAVGEILYEPVKDENDGKGQRNRQNDETCLQKTSIVSMKFDWYSIVGDNV